MKVKRSRSKDVAQHLWGQKFNGWTLENASHYTSNGTRLTFLIFDDPTKDVVPGPRALEGHIEVTPELLRSFTADLR